MLYCVFNVQFSFKLNQASKQVIMNPIFLCSTSWEGWYAAPSPFGRTEFTVDIDSADEDGNFSGEGRDKQGEFRIKGKVVDGNVKFTKDYKDGSHTGVVFEGVLEDGVVKGKYKFLFKKAFISMNICEEFSMKIVKSK